MRGARLSLAAWLVTGAILAAPLARAETAPAVGTSSDDGLFTSATQALREGRPSEAIANFEALGDQGVVDAAISYDRGLAYTERIRAGGEQPGDLGRAAQGFEEARELAADNGPASIALSNDAARALTLVRAEVARRRARAGEPVALDQGASLGRTIVQILPENAWAFAAAIASIAFAIGLFVRQLSQAKRARIGGTLTSSIAMPLLVLTAFAAFAARDDRLHLREGVMVSAAARPSDERGIVRPGATPLPEAARVEIVETKPGWTRVRWAAVDAWVPSQTVRPIAHAERATAEHATVEHASLEYSPADRGPAGHVG